MIILNTRTVGFHTGMPLRSKSSAASIYILTKDLRKLAECRCCLVGVSAGLALFRLQVEAAGL